MPTTSALERQCERLRKKNAALLAALWAWHQWDQTYDGPFEGKGSLRVEAKRLTRLAGVFGRWPFTKPAKAEGETS